MTTPTNNTSTRATEIGIKALTDFKSATNSASRGDARTIGALIYAHEDGLFDDPIMGVKIDLATLYQSPGTRTEQGERLNRVVQVVFQGMEWNEDSEKKNKWELSDSVTEQALTALKKSIMRALPIVGYLVKDFTGLTSVTAAGKLSVPFTSLLTADKMKSLAAKEVNTEMFVTLNNMSQYGIKLTVAQLGRVAKIALGISGKGADAKKSGEGFSLREGAKGLSNALAGADKEILSTVKPDTKEDMLALMVSLVDVFGGDGKGQVDWERVRSTYEQFVDDVDGGEVKAA